NGFKSAKFTIVGALTEFGLCAEGNETGVRIGGLLSLAGVPGDPDVEAQSRSRITKIHLVAQLVDVETAETVKVFDARAAARESGKGRALGAFGAGVNTRHQERSPGEAASKAAIEKIVFEMSEYFRKQGAS